MRGDKDQLARTQANLVGVASIDVASARMAGGWHLPADGAPVAPGSRLELDVVVRNLLVGHRFPGGVLDMQDTWIEVEVVDHHGARGSPPPASPTSATPTTPTPTCCAASSPTTRVACSMSTRSHARAARLADARTARGAGRSATCSTCRRTLRADLFHSPSTARLRHRSRALRCRRRVLDARIARGREFLGGARGAATSTLDPCAPQPITLIAETHVELGTGARHVDPRGPRGSALRARHGADPAIVTRQGEAEACSPPRSRSFPTLAPARWCSSSRAGSRPSRPRRRGARALVSEARALARHRRAGVRRAARRRLVAPEPAGPSALAPARRVTENAPQNGAAWPCYAQVLVAVGDHTGALAATAPASRSHRATPIRCAPRRPRCAHSTIRKRRRPRPPTTVPRARQLGPCSASAARSRTGAARASATPS